jgi:predicted DNA-binding transcriptional regulator AlpA
LAKATARTKTSQPQHQHTTGRLHLDKRAHQLAEMTGDDETPDDLLTTREVATWFGVSSQWLEIGRGKNYGPPYLQLGNNVVRYHRGKCKEWLHTRVRTTTADYASAADRRIKPRNERALA